MRIPGLLVKVWRRLRRLFRPRQRWFEIDMRKFVKAENARYIRPEVQL